MDRSQTREKTTMNQPMMSSRLWFCSGVVLCLCLLVAALSADIAQHAPGIQDENHSPGGRQGPRQPNIIFILTDDQDQHMSSLDFMPHLQEHLVKEGTTFSHHYCTVALCCPSRVSLWTGKHAHNTNVTDVNPPHGGYPKFVANGFNDAYLPLWLQDAGYNTAYVGKLFNAHSTSSYNKPYPRGWNYSDFLLDPFTYEYLNATMQRNIELAGQDAIHEEPRSYEGQYVTDVIAEKSYEFLEEAIRQRYDEGGDRKPFFLTIAPTAPHSNVHIHTDLSDGHGGKYKVTTATQSPPIAAKRHEHLFEDAVVPRTPDFNPNQNSKVSWLKTLPKQNQTNIDSNDHFYRQRLRALQAVDEIIPRIVLKLEFADALKETYIVFSTDNGYHIGQHRLQPGKQCAFETDVNVPMIVRGPEVLKGRIEDKVSSHVDLASTFLSLAGVDQSISNPRYGLDGQQMVFHYFRGAAGSEDTARYGASVPGEEQKALPAPSPPTYQTRDLGQGAEHVNIEMWGIIMPEGKYGTHLYPNHTYKALRVISSNDAYNLLYVVWCNNEHELYDLRSDPYALNNLFFNEDLASTHLSVGSPDKKLYTLGAVVARLDALLMVLKTCKEKECIRPWEAIHRDRTVQSLADAMHEAHNDLYIHSMPRVIFERCEEAYIPEAEGTLWSDHASMWPLLT